MVGVLIVSGGGRCWGDTKGLAGVTKGMVVSTKRTVVSALVSGAGTRTHRHGNPAVFLLDGHRWERAVEGTRGRRVHGGGSGSVGALTARCAALARRRHVGVQGGELRHHLLILFCLVGVDGLCVLSEVVQSRELLATVASKRPLAGVLSDVPGEVLAPTKDHTTLSVAPALESLGRGGAVALRVGGLGSGGLRGGGLEDRLGNM